MQIEKLRQMVHADKIVWTDHVRKRMEQRRIVKEEIVKSILYGEIIENYPNSYPFPSCLILGKISTEKILHIVLGNDGENLHIITVYVPDKTRFESNYKVRRKK